MKRIGMLLVLVSLGLFSIGCQKPAETDSTSDAETAVEAPANGEAAPAGDEAATPAAGEATAPKTDEGATE